MNVSPISDSWLGEAAVELEECEMRVEFQPVDGSARVVYALEDPAFDPSVVVQGLPVRKFRSSPSAHHKPGLYWMASVSRHVPHESKLERSFLMTADFAGDVLEVLPQPCVLHFERKVAPRRHTPDYLVRRRGQCDELVDVKGSWARDKLDNQVKFTLAGRACGTFGWQFTVFTELDPVVSLNVEFLAGYRGPLLQSLDVNLPHLVDAVGDGATVGETIGRLTTFGVDEGTAPAVVWRGAWKRVVEFDVDRWLSFETRLSVAGKGTV